MAEQKHNSGTTARIPVVTYAPRPPRLRKPPFILIAVALVSIVASWVPLVLFARARVIPSPNPRVQIMQDMGVQPRYSVQQSSVVFADGRADRLPIPGTVARGHLEEDDHYWRGYSRIGGTPEKPEVKFFDGFPTQVKLNDVLLHRGQERFNIYCSVCHGLDGHGRGSVNDRALELMQQDPAGGTNWVQAADLTGSNVPSRPAGHIYNTINVGIRSMPGYGAQVPAADRWAIVAYVRALQANQARNTPPKVASVDQGTPGK